MKMKITLNESDIKEMVSKSIEMLFENRESKNIHIASQYARERGYNGREIVDSIRHDIPNVRLAQYKYLYGVVRLYIDGDLNNAETITRLNQTLKYIASDAHINEYDNNFNGLNLETLLQRFATVHQDNLKQDRQSMSLSRRNRNADYRIIKINNFDEASKYGKYTSWCVTHAKGNYDSYTNNGENVFYFCLKNGFEDVPKVEGEGCPLDEYGLSMIAISVNFDGSINTCTCRWNHDNGGNDSIMDTKQISDILGVNFYEVFKPKPNPWMDIDFQSLDVDHFEEEFIDLGLPSGTKWSSKTYKYFTWDEAKEKFSNSLPTKEESQELYDNCKWYWRRDKKGYIVMGQNKKYIFLPASGYRYGSSGGISYVGSRGYYWLASSYSQSGAYGLGFYSSNVIPQYYNYRAYGFSVVPCARPQNLL